MLPTCTSSQKIYFVGHPWQVSTYPDSAADSPGAACQAFVASPAGGSGTYPLSSISASECRLVGLDRSYPVIKVCEPAAQSPFTMSVADGVQLSALILSVWVSAAIFKWFVRAVSDKGDKDD